VKSEIVKVDMRQWISRFAEYLKIRQNYSPHTISSYQSDLIQCYNFLSAGSVKKEINWNSLKRIDIRNYLSELNLAGLNTSSIERKLAAIKHFFDFLIEEEVVKTNPASGFSRIRKQRNLPSVLTENQIRDLFKTSFAGTFSGMRDKAALELFYSSGLRLSELLEIKINEIDLSSNLVRVTGKGNRQRIVPIGEFAVDAIKLYVTYRESLLSGKRPQSYYRIS